MKKANKAFYKVPGNEYTVKRSSDNKKYVDWKTVRTDTLNISDGNSKVGKVLCFNLPVFYTCDHKCECYKSGKCYACGGCYLFSSNQATYSENFAFIRSHSTVQFVNAMNALIKTYPNRKYFRWFTCGDIVNKAFFRAMCIIARDNPDVVFWAYTKKYSIVNGYVAENGLASIPENLTIIFSHWLNNDGTYYPMDNRYNFPVSEFIPLGMEDKTETVTHICPCSDPTVNSTCETCEHGCYTLKHGESMALLEHSTTETRDRDRKIKAAKSKLKKAARKNRTVA